MALISWQREGEVAIYFRRLAIFGIDGFPKLGVCIRLDHELA